MKNLITAALVTIAIASPASAEKKPDLCTAVNSLAITVMTARQGNMLLSDVLEAIKGSALAVDITLMAFDTPRYSTEEYQQNSIKEFGNDMLLACLKEGL